MAIRKVKLPDGTYVDVHDNRMVLTSPSEGQLMKYDSETGNIVNEDAGFIPDPGPVSVNDGDVIEGIVQDYDGNWYNGVVLNNQIWLKENLRVTHNPAGDSITYYHVNDDSNNDETYGLLYDWNTMMNTASSSNTVPSGVQGIAPDGWHIPSSEEFEQFFSYIGSKPQYRWNDNRTLIAKSLASKTGWNESTNQDTVGNNPSTNDATCFSAFPAGKHRGYFAFFSLESCFWTTTESGSGAAKGRFLTYNTNVISYVEDPKWYSFSVRCVMNTSASDWFAQNTNRLYLKYTTNGVVWNQLSSVAESGSYNDLLDKPTIPSAQVQSDWEQNDSSEVDFIKNKPNLSTVATSGSYNDLLNKPTIPTIRTMNGEQLTDSSLGDINIHDGFYFPNAVQDYDGNWYGAVVIGNQVWLGENLRTTHYSDGVDIPIASVDRRTSIAYDFVNQDETNTNEYGLVYNWYAVVRGIEGSSTPIQGLAPVGWHIPTQGEFENFALYLRHQKRYISDPNDQNSVSKSVASSYLWSQSSNNYTPGYNQEKNNSSGFNAKPAGYGYYLYSQQGGYIYYYGSLGYATRFWTSVKSNASYAYGKIIRYGEKDNPSYNTGEQYNMTDLFSVRCISDLTPIQFRDWYIKQYGSLQHILPAAQIQSDWNQTDSSAVDYIKNKPVFVEDAFVIELYCDEEIEDMTSQSIVTCNVDAKQIIQAFLNKKKFVYYLKCKNEYSEDVYTQLFPSHDLITDMNRSGSGDSVAYYFYISLEYPVVNNVEYGIPERSFCIEGNVQPYLQNGTNTLSCWAEPIATTINTTNTTAQTPINTILGRGININLHKVSSTGSYNDLLNKPTIPTIRTMNGEQLTDSSLGDINIHDGFYFPNAVQDYDGNWYGAVVIGNQVWLGENLRTTHYSDGTAIENIYNNTDSDISLKKRGLLYKYTSAVNNSSSSDIRIECMFDNWFVPTREDFQGLVSYLNKQKRFSHNEGGFYYQSKCLASNSYWEQSSTPYAVGYNLSENNKTGFNCYPTGYYMTNYGVTSTYSNAKLWMVRTSIFPYGGYGGLLLSSSLKQAQVTNTDSTMYHPLRCISNLTPIEFRNWYIEQYGSLQHILPTEQEQADWNQTDSSAPDFIKNKPDISTVTFRFW